MMTTKAGWEPIDEWIVDDACRCSGSSCGVTQDRGGCVTTEGIRVVSLPRTHTANDSYVRPQVYDQAKAGSKKSETQFLKKRQAAMMEKLRSQGCNSFGELSVMETARHTCELASSFISQGIATSGHGGGPHCCEIRVEDSFLYPGCNIRKLQGRLGTRLTMTAGGAHGCTALLPWLFPNAAKKSTLERYPDAAGLASELVRMGTELEAPRVQRNFDLQDVIQQVAHDDKLRSERIQRLTGDSGVPKMDATLAEKVRNEVFLGDNEDGESDSSNRSQSPHRPEGVTPPAIRMSGHRLGSYEATEIRLLSGSCFMILDGDSPWTMLKKIGMWRLESKMKPWLRFIWMPLGCQLQKLGMS
ncbi:hypothetical protein BSKO_04336 [Bryopsis sp. KO-2023]|nr:hypothetical protein BSKO_04336 [Bryopsis sp. KO-2023]